MNCLVRQVEAPVVQASAVSQWSPEYPAVHSQPQSPVVPVGRPPCWQSLPSAPCSQSLVYASVERHRQQALNQRLQSAEAILGAMLRMPAEGA